MTLRQALSIGAAALVLAAPAAARADESQLQLRAPGFIGTTFAGSGAPLYTYTTVRRDHIAGTPVATAPQPTKGTSPTAPASISHEPKPKGGKG
ncbi:MAG: hypothetical protein NVS4B5_00440 [Vulcanimicrobiaceae bacterium]